MKYKIVRAFSTEGVIRKANKLMQEGWKLEHPLKIGIFFPSVKMYKE